MTVYCNAVECQNNYKGKCINQFQTGEEAIKIKETCYGFICTDYLEDYTRLKQEDEDD